MKMSKDIKNVLIFDYGTNDDGDDYITFAVKDDDIPPNIELRYVLNTLYGRELDMLYCKLMDIMEEFHEKSYKES